MSGYAYVVGSEDGEYSDYSHEVLGVFTNEDDARRAVEEQKASDVRERLESAAKWWDSSLECGIWPAVGSGAHAPMARDKYLEAQRGGGDSYYIRRYPLGVLTAYEEL